MLFDWFDNRRRRRLLETPFPAAWRAILERNIRHYRWLLPDERERLCQLVQIFVAEKHWEAFGGLSLDDEVRVTIAGQACLLLLGLEHELYQNVETIYVYPSTVIPRRVQDPYFAAPTIVNDVLPVLGEAHMRGPIVLAWDAVRRSGRHPERGHNLVVHEFAHKLDMLDGAVDGVPPLGSAEEYRRWRDVCRAEYEALTRQTEQGEPTLLDSYGLKNPGEFFAVATEAFFDQPLALKERHPALYEVLSGFYQQDTAARELGAMNGSEEGEATPPR